MKKRKSEKDRKRKIGRNIERAMLVLLMAFSLGLSYQLYMEEHFMIYKKTLRFHVRAANDTVREQQIKLKVRDQVLKEIHGAVSRASGASSLRTMLEGQTGTIRETARDTLRKNHSAREVKVHFTRERFPLRIYGGVAFPAGEYQALRIDIGPAGGHNWWCAIYPELCYNAEKSFTLSRKGERELKRILSPEEQQTLRGGKMQFRFRILEWLSGIKKEK